MAKAALPRIFVTLAAPSLSAMEALAVRVSGSPVGYELRLDHLKDTTDLEAQLHQMFIRLHSPQTIATCRRVEAGGLFAGSVEQQAALLCAAVRAGCPWVDMEIESLGHHGAAILHQFRPAKVLVSFHDYRKTPAPGVIYRRLARLPAQAIKIAGTARELRDNLKIARLLKAHHGHGPKLVALALGVSGIPSRLLGLSWGSHFTYASAGDHLSVAPGQLPAELMRSTYRVEHLDQRAQIYGVVGTRASMSLSPPMQNAAFQAKHVNAVYLPCETERLSDFLAFARELGFLGFSVTMPFKRTIIRNLDWLDPLAAGSGHAILWPSNAVNGWVGIRMPQLWLKCSPNGCGWREAAFWCWARGAQDAPPPTPCVPKGPKSSFRRGAKPQQNLWRAPSLPR